MVGGYSACQAVSDEDKALFAKVASEISAQANGAALTPEMVCTQVVNGTNYKFSASAADGTKYEVVIYQKGPWDGGETSLTSVTKK